MDVERKQSTVCATTLFDNFVSADTFRGILQEFGEMCISYNISNSDRELESFYSRLRHRLLKSWKAQKLYGLLDKRAAHRDYKKQTTCSNLRVLVIGAGPCGLRVATECALLGAKVTVVEKRTKFSRNNVLHLWPFVIQDLKNLGAKLFYPKFCAGSIDHISIRQLQCLLLKTALLLGVDVAENVEYCHLIEPTDDGRRGWHAKVEPSDHIVNEFEFDVLIGADGKQVQLPGFKRKWFRGKLAIGVTANFVNRHSQAEERVPEISGIAFVFNQQFFKDLKEVTGIDLENIVYYKDETHYFVMCAKKRSLIEKNVIREDSDDFEMLLRPENINNDALYAFAREAANFATEGALPHLDFEVNHHKEPDVAVFDFTSLQSSESSTRILKRKGHELVLSYVGDSLHEPFWPTGSGIGRGFLSCFDTAWLLRSFSSGRYQATELLADRESTYRLLAQTSQNTLHRKYNKYSLDPRTRYAKFETAPKLQPPQMRDLFDTDEPIVLFQSKNSLLHPQRHSNTLGRKQARSPNNTFYSEHRKLIKWCQQTVAPYRLRVDNLSSSFQSGLIFAGIIHRYRPDFWLSFVDFLLDAAKGAKMSPDNQRFVYAKLGDCWRNYLCLQDVDLPKAVLVYDTLDLSQSTLPSLMEKEEIGRCVAKLYEIFAAERPQFQPPDGPTVDITSPPPPSSARKSTLKRTAARVPVSGDEVTPEMRTSAPPSRRKAKSCDSPTSSANGVMSSQLFNDTTASVDSDDARRKLMIVNCSAKKSGSITSADLSSLHYTPKEEDRRLFKTLAKLRNQIAQDENRDKRRILFTPRPNNIDKLDSDRVVGVERMLFEKHEQKVKSGSVKARKMDDKDLKAMHEKLQDTGIGKALFQSPSQAKVYTSQDDKYIRVKTAEVKKLAEQGFKPKEEENRFNMVDEKLRQANDRMKNTETAGVYGVGDLLRHHNALSVSQRPMTIDFSQISMQSLPTEKAYAPAQPVSYIKATPPPVKRKPPIPRPVLAIDKQNPLCSMCEKRVYLAEKHSVEGVVMHRNCFRCEFCNVPLRLGSYGFDRTPLLVPNTDVNCLEEEILGHFFCMHHLNLPLSEKIKKVVVKRILLPPPAPAVRPRPPSPFDNTVRIPPKILPKPPSPMKRSISASSDMIKQDEAIPAIVDGPHLPDLVTVVNNDSTRISVLSTDIDDVGKEQSGDELISSQDESDDYSDDEYSDSMGKPWSDSGEQTDDELEDDESGANTDVDSDVVDQLTELTPQAEQVNDGAMLVTPAPLVPPENVPSPVKSFGDVFESIRITPKAVVLPHHDPEVLRHTKMLEVHRYRAQARARARLKADDELNTRPFSISDFSTSAQSGRLSPRSDLEDYCLDSSDTMTAGYSGLAVRPRSISTFTHLGSNGNTVLDSFGSAESRTPYMTTRLEQINPDHTPIVDGSSPEDPVAVDNSDNNSKLIWSDQRNSLPPSDIGAGTSPSSSKRSPPVGGCSSRIFMRKKLADYKTWASLD